jgi:hypothetical protein
LIVFENIEAKPALDISPLERSLDAFEFEGWVKIDND